MGCCMSVPPHKDEYIGHWMSVDAREKSQIIFHENGKIEFMDGDGSEYSGYIIRWWEEDRNTWAFTTNTFCCCFAAGRTFLVQKEPVEESGNWKVNFYFKLIFLFYLFLI